MINSFPKQVAEEYVIAVEFSGKLPSGASLSSGTVSAIDTTDGSDASGIVLGSTSATISGTQAKVQVKNGTSGKRYKRERRGDEDVTPVIILSRIPKIYSQSSSPVI